MIVMEKREASSSGRRARDGEVNVLCSSWEGVKELADSFFGAGVDITSDDIFFELY